MMSAHFQDRFSTEDVRAGQQPVADRTERIEVRPRVHGLWCGHSLWIDVHDGSGDEVCVRQVQRGLCGVGYLSDAPQRVHRGQSVGTCADQRCADDAEWLALGSRSSRDSPALRAGSLTLRTFASP
jgi:hypothetical protein